MPKSRAAFQRLVFLLLVLSGYLQACSEANFQKSDSSPAVDTTSQETVEESPTASPVVEEVESELVLITQGQNGSAQVACPQDFHLEEGGCWSSNAHLHIIESQRSGEGWYCKAVNEDPGENGSNEHIKAYATCISL